MINEDYCSFEVSKLLRDKGFDEPCMAIYSPKGVVRHYLKEEVYAHQLKGHKKLCPTHQMAMKWLREKHKIMITIIPQEVSVGVDRMCYAIYRITEDLYQPLCNGKVDSFDNSYEEAIEAAIKYSLENLI